MNNNNDKKHKDKVFLAAGGTGGHLFPAESLGEELIVRDADVSLITDHRGAHFKGHLMKKIKVHEIYSATFKSGILPKLKALLHLSIGFIQSFYLLLRHRPNIVVGFGGYPSLPIVLTAQLLKIPTILHDQNGVLGKANKFLAKRADKIATSFPHTESIHADDMHKVVYTGNPVRPAILHKRFDPYQKPNDEKPFRLFITGGSQGAKIFSDVIPQALALLPENLRTKLSIVQQCRKDDLQKVRQDYNAANIQAELSDFFFNVEEQISKAHLIIARSGASTVSDIATIGRPAIYVPLYHEDKQQFLNANAITDAGGGWVMVEDGFTPQSLAARIESLMRVPDTLAQTAQKAKECGKPDAAKNLAQLVLQCLDKNRKGPKS